MNIEDLEKIYNKMIIRSEQVRLWTEHFKKTGEKLNVRMIEIDVEKIKHLFYKKTE